MSVQFSCYLANCTALDVTYFSSILVQVTLSFNIRSVGQNKAENEISTGDRFLELFLHSIGVILTSVQETEMKCVTVKDYRIAGNFED